MEQNNIPADVQERIFKEAKEKMLTEEQQLGYAAGAFAILERAQKLVDALGMAKREIVALYKKNGYSESFVTRTIDEVLSEWKDRK